MKRILVFDFDGVLVDSNKLKQKAFFDLFLKTDAKTHSLIKNVISEAPFHFSRFQILKEIFVKLGCAFESIQKRVDEYERKYRLVVRDQIFARGLIFGVEKMLDELQREGRILFLNSATPHDSLIELVDGLGIRKYFSRIYGRPPNKTVNLMDIMTRERAKQSDLVMVGDGKEDMLSAKALNIFFIGVVNEWNGWAGVKEFPVAENVFAAIQCLKKIEGEGGEAL